MHPSLRLGNGRHVVSTVVSVSNSSGINRLWIQAHNLSYAGKASVRINGGSWIPLNNQNATCAHPESSYECIAGAYSTVRFTVPVSNVRDGNNTVEFGYNGTDGNSSGYRILSFNFLPQSFSGNPTVKAVKSAGRISSSFVEENPSNWAPPRTSNSDISNGAKLWSTRDRLVTEPGGTRMWASCADCHARDGRDLQYFAYSNESIQVRSQFHGLSATEGEQIASYIRSLAVESHGRPWNPPYQPGPGLDNRPVEEWSAGAGLEWVMDDDAETLPYMFPNGINNATASTKSTLNLREVPIALQLADWNGWLPRVHPMDGVFKSDFARSKAWAMYNTNELHQVAASGDISYFADEILTFENFVTEVRRNLQQEFGSSSNAKLVNSIHSMQLWQIVKVWELMQTYQLEDDSPKLYRKYGEPRSWISKARNLFDVAPHITGEINPPQSGCCAPYGSELQNKVASHRWYHAQLILNAGQRDIGNITPIDFKYQFGHLGGATKDTGQGAAMRMVATYIKMIQMSDNGRGVIDDGWYIRNVHPSRIFEDWNRKGKPGKIWNGITQQQQRQISEVVLRAFLRTSMEFSPSDWPRDNGMAAVEPTTYTPKPWDGDGGWQNDHEAYADNFYRIVQVGKLMNLSPTLLDSVAYWGESMWPRGNWESLIVGASGGGSDGGDKDGSDDGSNDTTLPIELTAFKTRTTGEKLILIWKTESEVNNAGFEIQQQIWDNPSTDPGLSAPYKTLTFIEGAGTTNEQQRYKDRVTNLARGQYRFRLRQIDTDGTITNSKPIDVTMDGSDDVDVTTHPNPFNPMTMITLHTPVTQDIEVTVYDVQGRLVRTLFKGELYADEQKQIRFDATGLASGLYLVRAQGPSFLVTKTVTLLR
jgi:hypothetical protein